MEHEEGFAKESTGSSVIMSRAGFFKGASQLLLAEGLLIPTGFVTAVYLARELRPANYGSFALISLWVVWMEGLLVSGLESTTIRLISGSRRKKPLINTIYAVYGGAGVLAAIGMMALAPAVARLVQSPELSSLIVLLCFDIPIFFVAQAGRHIASGCGKHHQNALLRSTYFLSRLVFIVLFVRLGLSIRGAILGLICASAAEALLGLFLARPDPIRGGFARLNRFWRYLAPLQMAEINMRLLNQELMVLRALGGTASTTGWYGAAKNLAIVPVLLIRAIRPTLLSTLNQARQRGEEYRAREVAVSSLRAFFWFLPPAVLLASCSREVVLFVYGSPYSFAAPLFPVLLFAGMGLLVIHTGNAIFAAWARPELSIRVSWPLVPAAVLGILMWYQKLGPMGIALAVLMAAAVGAAITWSVLFTMWRLFPPISTMLKSLVCAGLVFAASRSWPVSGWMIVVKLCTVALLGVGILWVLGEYTASERQFLRGLLGRKSGIPEGGESRPDRTF